LGKQKGQLARRQTVRFCLLETLLDGFERQLKSLGDDQSAESPHLEVNQGRTLVVREIAETEISATKVNRIQLSVLLMNREWAHSIPIRE